jgi:hypothetical protein
LALRETDRDAAIANSRSTAYSHLKAFSNAAEAKSRQRASRSPARIERVPAEFFFLDFFTEPVLKDL